MIDTFKMSLITVAIATIGNTAAYAADDLQALKAEMSAMQKRISELEAQQKSAIAMGSTKSGEKEGWNANSDAFQVYGQLRLSIDNKSGDVSDGTDINSNASRLGVKGSLPSGLGDANLVYQAEMGYDSANTSSTSITMREGYAGLSSKSKGTVKLGRLNTGYKTSLTTIDPWNDNIPQSRSGGRQGSSELHSNYFYNAISYDSPKVGPGVTLNTWYATNSGSKELQGAGAAVNYLGGNAMGAGIAYNNKNSGLFLAADAIDIDADAVSGGIANGSGWQLSGKYKPGKFGVAAFYEDADDLGLGKNIYVNATYDVIPKTILIAAYGKNEGRVPNGNKDWDNWSLGVKRKLNKKSELFAAYNSRKDSADIEDNTLTTGINMKFGY